MSLHYGLLYCLVFQFCFYKKRGAAESPRWALLGLSWLEAELAMVSLLAQKSPVFLWVEGLSELDQLVCHQRSFMKAKILGQLYGARVDPE